jgi:hypothetical protein
MRAPVAVRRLPMGVNLRGRASLSVAATVRLGLLRARDNHVAEAQGLL